MPILSPDILEFTSTSADQTVRLGFRLGELLEAGDCVCLSGGLGAGKTAFASGVGRGWGAREPVNSPTFVFSHEHRRDRDAQRLYHVDCYRLASAEDAESIGIEEILSGEHCVLIEWPERIRPYLPGEALWISFLETELSTRRLLQFRAIGACYLTRLEDFRRASFGR